MEFKDKHFGLQSLEFKKKRMTIELVQNPRKAPVQETKDKLRIHFKE